MKPVPGILDIAPYIGGRNEAAGHARVFKLSSNESPLGPSPKAIEAFKAASGSLHLYPEGSAAALRAAIADVFDLSAERIVCGNGSDELLHLLPQIYAGPGDEVLFSEHGFLVYKIAALAASAVPVIAPEPNLVTDVDALLARATPKTKVVFVANPNNPTGSYNTAAELRRLRAGLPKECLLVIDAAYAEYVNRNDYESGLELAATTENTVMTRTFSKIYGLAALRVGWAYGPPGVIDALNRIRGPFNVSTAGQAAAIAAMRDRAHVDVCAAHNAKWLHWLAERITATGLKVRSSVGNFLLIEFEPTGAKTAAAADQFLMQRGVILRGVAAYGLPNCLRISVGTEDGNKAAVSALEEFMSAT
ncbi:MAG: histidinol-phosphate transaminase [Alphaproteobacteria bacterium]|nr:histidinol-phosphate transaminase [Alphaproteobacteria bacterium]